jgi:hypothetical protein
MLSGLHMQDIKIGNKATEHVAELKEQREENKSNQNSVHDKSKSKFPSGNDCLYSVQKISVPVS